MRKSEHVRYHQNKLKECKKLFNFWKNIRGDQYARQFKYRYRVCNEVRFPRRIARWKAYILDCGYRNYVDRECQYNKKKENEQKNFVEIVEDLNKDKKLGSTVDIKI